MPHLRPSVMWSPLQADYFDEYRIEGRDERNEIYLEVPLDQMTRAFRSAHSAQVLKMKLARKEGALLCFEILQVTPVFCSLGDPKWIEVTRGDRNKGLN